MSASTFLERVAHVHTERVTIALLGRDERIFLDGGDGVVCAGTTAGLGPLRAISAPPR